jgi:hypothetical protein
VLTLVWLLGLQLHVQSVPFITKVVISNPAHDEVHSIQHYVIKFVNDAFFSCVPVSSTNKTDHYEITEILWKVTLNTITLAKKVNVFLILNNVYITLPQHLNAHVL